MEKRLFYEFLWRFWAIAHIVLIFAHIVAFFVLCYEGLFGSVPWYVALPGCSWMFYTGFARHRCPLTDFENKYRKKAGRRQVTGWVGHYFLKLPKQILGVMPWDPLPYEAKCDNWVKVLAEGAAYGTDQGGHTHPLPVDGGCREVDTIPRSEHGPA